MSARRYFVVLSFDPKADLFPAKKIDIAHVHVVEKLVRAALGAPTRSPLAWNTQDDLGWPEGGRHQATFLYTGSKKTLLDLRTKFFALLDFEWNPAFSIQVCKMSRTAGLPLNENSPRRSIKKDPK